MGEYRKKKLDQEQAEYEAEKKRQANLRREAEMAANREKAEELLKNGKDVTTIIEETEENRQEESAAAIEKAKDKAKDLFDEIKKL